jgi:hypothetical protein
MLGFDVFQVEIDRENIMLKEHKEKMVHNELWLCSFPQ